MSARLGDEEAGKIEIEVAELKPRDNHEEGDNRDGHGDEGESHDQEALLRDEERDLTNDDEKVVRIKWLAEFLENFWDNHRGNVWIFLMALSNLTARRLFRGRFPYPFYFTFLLQITSSVTFEIWAIYKCVQGFRKNRLQAPEWQFGSSFLETFFHVHRLLLYSASSFASTLLHVYILMRYPNFYVLALFPVFSYICDSIFLHLASVVKLHPRRKLVDYLHFASILLVGGALVPVFITDYRLEESQLGFAFVIYGLESFSRSLLAIGSDYKEQRLNSTTFFIFERLLISTPQVIASGVVAFKLENTVDALHRLQSWDFLTIFWALLPGTLLLLFYGNGLTSVYRPASHEGLISVLEEVKPLAKVTVGATLHAAILFSALQAFREPVLLNWFQAVGFSSIYVVSLGPLHVGLYPQRFHNFIAFLSRRRQRHIGLKSWSLFVFLLVSSFFVGVFFAFAAMYWSNTIAYNRNASTFINPPKANIDYDYRPPRIRGLDVIIAHSKGHSHEALYKQVERLTTSKKLMGVGPYFHIITKDEELVKKSDPKLVKDNHIDTIPNVGGQAATFIHFILTRWNDMPVQILFVSSAKDGEFNPNFMIRLHEYFVVQGFPLADAEPKSGFLNLGESEVCDCNNCHDSEGWEDTFGLVPSMYAAARPNITACESVLLTRGNHFLTSAARIRGIPKDVWQTLYDGLTSTDSHNGWAHEVGKIPKMLPGEKKMGRWDPQNGVYGTPDSVEEPLLGRTVERLWGVLLQCSKPEIAWRCAGLEKGWRLYGSAHDCGCIDEMIPGFV